MILEVEENIAALHIIVSCATSEEKRPIIFGAVSKSFSLSVKKALGEMFIILFNDLFQIKKESCKIWEFQQTLASLHGMEHK